MTVVILDEDGIREIDIEQESIMCANCLATNESWRKNCRNCDKKLEMMKCRN